MAGQVTYQRVKSYAVGVIGCYAHARAKIGAGSQCQRGRGQRVEAPGNIMGHMGVSQA